MNSPEQRIAQRARALYQQATQQLEPAVAARLRAARRDALAAPAPGHRAARLLLPAGAFAAVALAVLIAWPPHRTAGTATAPAAAAATARGSEDSDLPPDADSADPMLYQNLDFYGWLAANDGAGRTTR